MIDVVVGATKGKGSLRDLSGPRNMLRRVGVICRRYGATPENLDRIVGRFAALLSQFDCGATFPVTAVALARSQGVLEKYQGRHLEFAVHGYRHVDYTRLSLDEQISHLDTARRLFRGRGIACSGFRSPYLRCNAETLAAIRRAGFLYDASQTVAWDVLDGAEAPAYRHVLDFYGARPAISYPALPRLDRGLVRIPYCLPDDEALVDRLRLSTVRMSEVWLAILARTYALGELFTLGLHAERIDACEGSLTETLLQARALSPAVWIARLDEIARWWIARTAAVVTVTEVDGALQVSVEGPPGVTILARGVELMTPATDWDGEYRRVSTTRVRLRADNRPFVAVSRSSAPYLTDFLRQQGYIVEQAEADNQHALCLDRPTFGEEDERPLLAEIESSARSLVRLGRWPNGARSALCVTGDIDALTIWDYGLRLLGR